MKHLKKFKFFINESNVNIDDNVSTEVKVIKSGTKERIINQIRYKAAEKLEFDERGKDLFNQEVMKMPTDKLNLEMDSQRLEYTWRAISNNIEKALKEGKIVKDGKTLASNIKEGNKDGKDLVTYDFVFVNEDSKQYTDGKTPKTILAGYIKNTPLKEEVTQVKQVWVITSNNDAVSLAKIIHKKQEYANKKRALLEAGYVNVEGTYDYKKPDNGRWLNVNDIKQEDFDSKKYRFDVKELYKKYDITPR